MSLKQIINVLHLIATETRQKMSRKKVITESEGSNSQLGQYKTRSPAVAEIADLTALEILGQINKQYHMICMCIT